MDAYIGLVIADELLLPPSLELLPEDVEVDEGLVYALEFEEFMEACLTTLFTCLD